MKLDIEILGTRCAGHCYIMSKPICLQRPRNLKILCHIALFLFVSLKIQVFEHYQSYSCLAKILQVFVFISKTAACVFFLFYSADTM